MVIRTLKLYSVVRIEAENIQHVRIIWTFSCFFISPDPRLLACRAGDGV